MTFVVLGRSHPRILKRAEYTVIERRTVGMTLHRQRLRSVLSHDAVIVHIGYVFGVKVGGLHDHYRALELIVLRFGIMHRILPEIFLDIFRFAPHIEFEMNYRLLLILTDKVHIRF